MPLKLASTPQVQAMKYFRLAADQGHPHAAYNLAIGHLQGIETDVGPGEAHHLIRRETETDIGLGRQATCTQPTSLICVIFHCLFGITVTLDWEANE